MRAERDTRRCDSETRSTGGSSARSVRRVTTSPKNLPSLNGSTHPAIAEPDVHLDVPTLHVDEIDLRLDSLKARVALEAHVLDLLRLDVGIDADLRGVELDIKGVDAQALLQVRLDNLAVILDRVMSTVDSNPQILERLTEGLGSAVGNIGEGAGSAVKEVGSGAGSAVHDVGRTARTVVAGRRGRALVGHVRSKADRVAARALKRIAALADR
jgi:hypothetical protein